MHIIKKIYIEHFRAFSKLEIPLDKNVIAIAGQNGTMKTTLLGMLAQPFSLAQRDNPLYNARTIEGTSFKSDLRDKFKFSEKFDKIGSHIWTLTLDKTIYDKESFTCVSIDRKAGKKDYDIRFWSADKSRKAGTGYIQCPVIFLSLKRLLPLGEIDDIHKDTIILADSEYEFFKVWHNKILILTDKINSVHALSAKDKNSLGPDTDYSDFQTISSGQDNIGRIILAILSFSRLQKEHKDAYKGGMLFIDEIETTLYPASQIKLLDFLFKEASKLNLQIFFTTHSQIILEYLKKSKYTNETKIVYLKRNGNLINSYLNPSCHSMYSDLILDLLGTPPKLSDQINIFAEDKVAFQFFRNLIPARNRKDIALQVKLTLGAPQYRMILEHKIKPFTESIILLDGDMRDGTGGIKLEFIKKHKNIIFLPGKCFPEKLIYDFLWSLPQDDPFWDKCPGGYDKQKCFRDHPTLETEKDPIKEWFWSQKDYAGRNYSRFIGYWIKKNTKDVNDFRKDFTSVYEYIKNRFSK